MPKLLIACALVAGAAAGFGDSANWVTVNGQSTTPVANCGGSKQYVRRMQYIGSGSDAKNCLQHCKSMEENHGGSADNILAAWVPQIPATSCWCYTKSAAGAGGSANVGNTGYTGGASDPGMMTALVDSGEADYSGAQIIYNLDNITPCATGLKPPTTTTTTTTPTTTTTTVPVPTGTCQHVACSKVEHTEGFKIRVYHTTNNADGAHGPKPQNKHPQCLGSSNLMGCQDAENVYHECSYNVDTNQCTCLCDKVVATVAPTTTTEAPATTTAEALPAAWVGCYENTNNAVTNNNGHRTWAHNGAKTFAECEAAAPAGGYFGFEYPQGVTTAGESNCIVEELAIGHRPVRPDSECKEEIFDGKFLGDADRIAVYRRQDGEAPEPATEYAQSARYIGCYQNNNNAASIASGHRITSHIGAKTFYECEQAAPEGGYFGFEYPQGVSASGQSNCVVSQADLDIANRPTASDSQCERESWHGKPLGDADRIAVYQRSPWTTTTTEAPTTTTTTTAPLPTATNPSECVNVPNGYTYNSKSLGGAKLCCPAGFVKYGDGSGCRKGNQFCYTYGNDINSANPHPCPSTVAFALNAINPSECVSVPHGYNFKSKSLGGAYLCCPAGFVKYGDGSGCRKGSQYCYTYGNDINTANGHPCPSTVLY